MPADLFPIILATLLFGCTAVLFWQPAQGRRMASLVFSIYTTVCGAGVLALVYLPGTFHTPELLPLLHVYAAVLLLALPLHRFAEGRTRRILFPAERPFLCVAYGIGVISLAGNLTYLGGKISDLSATFGNLSFGDAYAEQSLVSSHKTTLSIANLPVVLAGASQDMVPFLLLCLLTLRKHLILKGVLATCSVLPLLAGLAQGARNKLVFFCIASCGAVTLFWSMLETGTRKRILVAAAVTFTLLTIMLLMVTASRFGTSGDTTPGESILEYAGQPLLEFAEYIYTAGTTCYGDMNFPLFRAILGQEYSASLPIRNHTWETALGVPLGVFYTFLGDLILDFGSLATSLLVLVIFATAMSLTRRRDGIASLHQILLIYLLFITAGQGAFYYQHKSVGGNLQLLFTLFCYLMFWLTTVDQVDAIRERG